MTVRRVEECTVAVEEPPKWRTEAIIAIGHVSKENGVTVSFRKETWKHGTDRLTIKAGRFLYVPVVGFRVVICTVALGFFCSASAYQRVMISLQDYIERAASSVRRQTRRLSRD